MQIDQLGMCIATIKFKNFKKKCVFFVVLGNGQALSVYSFPIYTASEGSGNILNLVKNVSIFMRIRNI